MEFANSDAFEDLRRLIDKEESLIDKDFLVLYTKLVFSKKVDIEISKTATLIAKSTRNFINQILDMEKFYKLSFVNLTDTERIILTLTNDCFDELTKVIDGDVMRDKFNSQIHDNKFYNDNEDLKKQLDIYLIDTILTDNIMDSIDQRFQKRKNIMSTIIQHEILTNFINNKYKDVKNISEYEESLIKVLKETLRNTSLSTQTKVLLMSNQNVDDIVKEEGQKFRIPTRYNIFDFPFNGGFENGRLYTFTGVSGGGKSVLLCNLAFTTKCSLDVMYANNEPLKKKNAVFYLSFENAVDETRTRLMCCSLGISRQQFKQMSGMSDEEKKEYDKMGFNNYHMDQIEKKYSKFFKDQNDAEIVIAWKAPNSMNALDVTSMIRDIERDYNINIKICFVDYADKMIPIESKRSSQEYQDLGKIYDELKAASVELEIPFVTVSQVNRSGYSKEKEGSQSSDNLAGSMRKKDNADVLVMMDFGSRHSIELDNNDNLTIEDFVKSDKLEEFTDGNYRMIKGTIDKNRDGPSQIKFKCFIDYTTYRFVDSLARINIIFADKHKYLESMNVSESNFYLKKTKNKNFIPSIDTEDTINFDSLLSDEDTTKLNSNQKIIDEDDSGEWV